MDDRMTDVIIAGLIGLAILVATASYLLLMVAAWKIVFGG